MMTIAFNMKHETLSWDQNAISFAILSIKDGDEILIVSGNGRSKRAPVRGCDAGIRDHLLREFVLQKW